MRNKRALPLDRDKIIAAAFVQLQQNGLDGLSMRRLATELNAQAPAIYRYVTDKAELLALMAHSIFSQANAAVEPMPDQTAWLIGYGHALRSVMASYRDGARLCAVAGPAITGSSDEVAAVITSPLAAFGLDRQHALLCLGAVISLALGWATFQSNEPMWSHLAEMFDLDASYDVALRALVKGLARDEQR